jgi:hypothetical protein
MISITQTKIAGLVARWAWFPGFSLLFDAPSLFYHRDEEVEALECDMADERLPGLFGCALAGLGRRDPEAMLRTYGFCPLPASSYHITAFDVVNVGDLGRCLDREREGIVAVLERLPRAEAFDAEILDAAREADLIAEPLTFRFAELVQWGSVLAVRLAPEDDEALGRFANKRAELSRHYAERYGVGASSAFTPHLSLGYFMNKEGAASARGQIEEWNRTMADAIGDANVTFESVSLHGFTDMATFFRRSV